MPGVCYVAKIYVIGVGPGSPDYITPMARKAVQNAHLVVGAERALSLFQGDIKGEALPLTGKNVGEALRNAIESAKIGKTVAVLSTGDPGFSGLLRPVLNNITEDIKVDVVPGISSIQVCAARLHMCWDETNLFSFHEGASHEKKMRLTEAVKKGRNVILLPDPKSFPPNEIAKFLINNEISKETPVVICENLTLPDEKIIMGTLESALKLNFGPLCVMVVGGHH
ncbi:MAG: precorrin-6y C5,15-methyltransferase (decarboxylating) subunit CbiE [archaeon]|nr:precorrin-6y C5,15-methyltransferase (decarboxylating) subunit CbiE [archaeon]